MSTENDEYCNFEEMRGLLSLNGKRALVIGSGSGIGLGITYGVLANGGTVMAADINEKALEKLRLSVEEKEGTIYTEMCDLTSVNSVRNLYSAAIEKLGKIDVVYVVAGIDPVQRIENFSYETFDRTIELNFKGAFIALKEIAVRIGKEFNGGSVVLIASSLTQRTEIGQGVYSATKGAVIQLARAFSAEMGKYNLRVNVIAPGIVETPMTEGLRKDKKSYLECASKSPLNRWARVKDVVGPALFLATEGAAFLNASVIFVDGGASFIDNRFIPEI